MIKRLRRNRYFALLLFITGVLFAFIADAVRDVESVALDITEESPVFTYAQMEHYDSDGQSFLLGGLTFEGGDHYYLCGEVKNLSEERREFSVKIMEGSRLYDGNYYEIGAGETLSLNERYAYGQTEHGESGLWVMAVPDGEVLDFSGIAVYRGHMESGRTGLTSACYFLSMMITAFCAAYVMYYIADSFRRTGWKKLNEKIDAAYHNFRPWLKDRMEYGIVFLIVLAGLLILYRKADLLQPLEFAVSGSDEHGSFFLINAIRQGNLNSMDPRAGGFFGSYFFDTPVGERFMFLFLLVLSYFANGVYLIANLFFFGAFFFNGLISVCVCRRLKLKRWSTVLVSVLYAFSPFAQQRYKHLGLELYGMLPVAILLALHIMRGDYCREEGQGRRKESLMKAVVLSVLVAQTGVYFTFFACILYAGAMIVCLIEQPKAPHRAAAGLPILLAGVGSVGINILPHLIFTAVHGSNATGNVARRGAFSSEAYGLRLFRLFLPRPDHRFGFLRVLADYVPKGSEIYPFYENESVDVTLGIIGAAGLIISLLWLFASGVEKEKRHLAYLNLIALLVAISGGVGTLFSVLVTPAIRAYCRMSLIILFLSLVTFAMLLEKLLEKKKHIWQVAIPLLLLGTGFLDQTVTYEAKDGENYEELRGFLSFMDYYLPEGADIFTLPYLSYPSGGSPEWMIATTETRTLRYSFAAPEGREFDQWYRHMSQAYPEELREYLKNSGYDAIFLDTELLRENYSEEDVEMIVGELKGEFGEIPFTTESHRYMLWTLE